MKVTFVGHAGMYLETTGGSILCDPWFNPAYFASWFPFPSNEDFPVDTISAPDYLFVSHLHQDHFDPEFLAARISRAATVLLPDYPLDELRRQLQDLGFSRFETLPNGVVVDLDGLRVMAATAIGPSDGPFGDCALAVDDGTARLLTKTTPDPGTWTRSAVSAPTTPTSSSSRGPSGTRSSTTWTPTPRPRRAA